MKHRIVLTRGEVDKIVRRHLEEEKNVSPAKPKRWLSVLSDSGDGELRLVKPTDPGTPWEAWPAYAIEWDEEV